MSDTTAVQAMPASGSQVPIHVRKFKFAGEADDAELYWHPAGPAVTLFIYVLSLAFPEAERFLIDSVRENRDRISDPKLLQDIQGFIGQEGYHSKEHERYNELLEKHGFHLKFFNKVAAVFAWLVRLLPRSHRLGVTCALEHFTAIIADQVLTNPAYLEGAEENHKALWRWHAVEETEHKSVSFDVYRATGGGEFTRILTMLGTSIAFVVVIFVVWLWLMTWAGEVWKPAHWKVAWTWLFSEPGLIVAARPAYREYFQRGFHPWQQDNSHLIEAWQRQYATDELAAQA